MGESKWYEFHDNLVTLTSYMAETGASAEDVAYAVEKPWKYESEFKAAHTHCVVEQTRFKIQAEA